VVDREGAKEVEGFTICLACLATDSELALSIARARHRKRLQEIRSEIESQG
jgi:hypothetical protein